MPRGFWDWGVNPTGLLTPPEIATPELAARLGSIDTHERQGEVIFLDSFEHGLNKWNTITAGAGAAVNLIASAARSGGYAADLVAGSDATRLAGIGHLQSYLAQGRFGVEFSALLLQPGQLLTLAVIVYTGTQIQGYRIRYDPQANLLQYLNSSAVWVTLASSVYLYPATTLWHTVKLVVDARTAKFTRLIVGSTIYDLSTIDASVAADTTQPNLDVSIVQTGRPGFNDIIEIDDFILTQNEP